MATRPGRLRVGFLPYVSKVLNVTCTGDLWKDAPDTGDKGCFWSKSHGWLWGRDVYSLFKNLDIS